jgi:N-acetylneuraminic acid mutarotase
LSSEVHRGGTSPPFINRIVFWIILAVGTSAQGALQLGFWQSLPSGMPTARAQHFTVTDPATGRIFIGGGYNSSDGSNPLTSTHMYDPATGNFTLAAPLPTPTRGAAATYSGGKIYVFGGVNGTRLSPGSVQAVQIYNIAANTWTSQPLSTQWESSAATLPDGNILVTGGHSTAQNILYNTTTGAVTALAAPSQRDGLETQVMGGKLLAAGGFTGVNFGPAIALVDEYDPINNTWSSAPADLPSARGRFASAALGQYFFAVGGTNNYTNSESPYYSDFLVYDRSANTWSSGPFSFATREAAASISGGYLYLTGGANGAGPSTLFARIQLPEPATLSLLCFVPLLLCRGSRIPRAPAQTG